VSGRRPKTPVGGGVRGGKPVEARLGTARTSCFMDHSDSPRRGRPLEATKEAHPPPLTPPLGGTKVPIVLTTFFRKPSRVRLSGRPQSGGQRFSCAREVEPQA